MEGISGQAKMEQVKPENQVASHLVWIEVDEIKPAILSHAEQENASRRNIL